MSGSDLRGQLVETLRQELGELRQHQAEPLADVLLPLVQAELDAKDRTIEHHNEVANTALKAWQAMKDDAERAKAELATAKEAFEAAIASTASDALEHRGCGLNLHGALRRAEQAEAQLESTLQRFLNQAETITQQRATEERVRALAVRWHHALATDEVHARALDIALGDAPCDGHWWEVRSLTGPPAPYGPCTKCGTPHQEAPAEEANTDADA